MFKKQPPIEGQIKVFLEYLIRQGNRCGDYNFWLREFVKSSGVEDAYDIEQDHIDSFLTDVSVLYNGQLALLSAEKAVKALVRFYIARGRNLGYKPEMNQFKKERNRQLVQMRNDNPAVWTWRNLGEYFSIHFTTAKELYEKHASKYEGKAIHR